jgi:hypothetical protein
MSGSSSGGVLGGGTDPLGGRLCCPYLCVLLFLPLFPRPEVVDAVHRSLCWVVLCCRLQVNLRSFSCSFTIINSSHTVMSVCSFICVGCRWSCLSFRLFCHPQRGREKEMRLGLSSVGTVQSLAPLSMFNLVYGHLPPLYHLCCCCNGTLFLCYFES